ncbi:MAG TPA: hypothetical protein VF170_03810, partial [Planctomycetaceae bacterium]
MATSSVTNIEATDEASRPELAVLPVADPAAELPPVGGAPGGVPLRVRVANLVAVGLPFAVFVAAVTSLWGRGFGWVDLSLLAGMYVLTVLGITVGFHRLFTHR